jgi:hypothetical protein
MQGRYDAERSLFAGLNFEARLCGRALYARAHQNAGQVAGKLADTIPSQRLLFTVTLPVPSSVMVQMLS